jgi:RNA polymerase sigma-70 factor (ECF subfamily)
MTSSIQGLTDERLMVEVQQGHRWALSSLYDRFVNRVYGMALQKLADPAQAQEVTQDIFVTLWQWAGTFRPEGGNLASWILTIAHNRINDHFRRNRPTGETQVALNHESAVEPGSAGGILAVTAERRGDALWVRRALRSLTDEQREVVVLSYYQGKSQSEISRQLGVPLDTVKSRMRLAVTGLRAVFKAGGT